MAFWSASFKNLLFQGFKIEDAFAGASQSQMLNEKPNSNLQ